MYSISAEVQRNAVRAQARYNEQPGVFSKGEGEMEKDEPTSQFQDTEPGSKNK